MESRRAEIGGHTRSNCTTVATGSDPVSRPDSRPQSKTPSKKLTLHVLAYLFCAFIWGTTWYGIRVCIGPGGYAACPAAALRFTISTLILALIWLVVKDRVPLPSFNQFRWVVACGLISGISYGLLYIAEEKISGGIAAVLSATAPIMAALLASLTKTEQLSKGTIGGLVLALLGVTIVFHDRLQISSGEAWAVGLMIVNCAINATSTVGLKRHVRGIAALMSNAIFFFGATISLWILSFLGGRFPLPTSIAPTIALLYLSLFGTVLAFALYFYLLRQVRLSTAMSLSFVTPIVALLVDALFEKHALLSPETSVGIAIVLGGVVLNVLSGMFLVQSKTAES
jgi:drug/metabolite transporter (DMT)-like permease